MDREQAEAMRQCPVCHSLGRPEAWRPGNPYWTLRDEVERLRREVFELKEQLDPKASKRGFKNLILDPKDEVKEEDVEINEQT